MNVVNAEYDGIEEMEEEVRKFYRTRLSTPSEMTACMTRTKKPSQWRQNILNSSSDHCAREFDGKIFGLCTRIPKKVKKLVHFSVGKWEMTGLL